MHVNVRYTFHIILILSFFTFTAGLLNLNNYNITLNPAASLYCWISIQTATSTLVMMQLYDSGGRLVKQQLENVQAGSNQVSVQLGHLAHGIYSLKVSWGKGMTKTVKIEKL